MKIKIASSFVLLTSVILMSPGQARADYIGFEPPAFPLGMAWGNPAARPPGTLVFVTPTGTGKADS